MNSQIILADVKLTNPQKQVSVADAVVKKDVWYLLTLIGQVHRM